MTDKRRTFHTMDGMRGVAALIVVTRHATAAFAPIRLPDSFLAVDLFFMLSGFVIGSAYDGRLLTGTLKPMRFMAIRYIRLWPLYLLGTLLSAAIVYSKIVHGKIHQDILLYWEAWPFAAAMLPSAVTRGLYPLNAVAWSLFYELFANLCYAIFYRHLSDRVLCGITIAGAVGVIVATLGPTSLDNGWDWANIWVGVARVGYAFPLGLLLFRHRHRVPHLGMPASVVLAVLAVTLALPVTRQWLPLAQLVCVFAVFPLLMAAALQIEPPKQLVPLCSLLGIASYAIYTLHHPMLTVIEWGLSKVGLVFSDFSPWSGLAALAVIAAFAWLVDRLYDKPVRAWLTARLPRVSPVVPGG